MRKSNHTTIRQYLRAQPEGATVRQMSDALSISKDSLRFALRSMPDTFIDRWLRTKGPQPQAIWCAVEVPKDCPRPETEACT